MSVGTIQANNIRVQYFGRLLAVLDVCREEREGKNYRPEDTYFQSYREILVRPVRIETEFAQKERQCLAGNPGEMTKEVQNFLSDRLSAAFNEKPSFDDLLYASVPLQEKNSDFETAYSRHLAELRRAVSRIKGA